MRAQVRGGSRPSTGSAWSWSTTSSSCAARARAENRVQEISQITRSLKALAKELDVPIVALSQLSRAAEQRSDASKRPQLSDLRESGAIEQDADVVIFVFREEFYKPDDPRTEGQGRRSSSPSSATAPPAIVKLTFLSECTRFENYSRDHGGVPELSPDVLASPRPEAPIPDAVRIGSRPRSATSDSSRAGRRDGRDRPQVLRFFEDIGDVAGCSAHAARLPSLRATAASRSTRCARSAWARCRSCIVVAVFTGAVAAVQAAYQLEGFVPLELHRLGDPALGDHRAGPGAHRARRRRPRGRVDRRRARAPCRSPSRSTRSRRSAINPCATSCCRASSPRSSCCRSSPSSRTSSRSSAGSSWRTSRYDQSPHTFYEAVRKHFFDRRTCSRA